MAHIRRKEEVREDHLPPPVIAQPPAPADEPFTPPESTISGTASIVYIPLIVEVQVPVEKTTNVCPAVVAKPKPARKPTITAKPSRECK